jgi:hypothetical protein
MPIREVCSPVNTMKIPKGGIEPRPPASRKVQHAAVYGPSARGDARMGPGPDRPASQGIVDATLTIKHTGDRR